MTNAICRRIRRTEIIQIIFPIGGSNMVTLAKPGQIVGGKQTIVINKPGAPGQTIKGVQSIKGI